MYTAEVNPSILWSQPGDREPAPDVALHLLQDFVNTNDVEGDDDGLGSPALLGAYRDVLSNVGTLGMGQVIGGFGLLVIGLALLGSSLAVLADVRGSRRGAAAIAGSRRARRRAAT